MEQVKRIVEIKVISDVQRKTLPAAASTPAVAAEVVAEPDQSREALSKQDENNTAQQSKSAGSKAVTGGGVKEGRVAAAEVGSESKGWKDAKDRGVQLDKEARQAMKEARFDTYPAPPHISLKALAQILFHPTFVRIIDCYVMICVSWRLLAQC
jgi:hypothetical protein